MDVVNGGSCVSTHNAAAIKPDKPASHHDVKPPGGNTPPGGHTPREHTPPGTPLFTSPYLQTSSAATLTDADAIHGLNPLHRM